MAGYGIGLGAFVNGMQQGVGLGQRIQSNRLSNEMNQLKLQDARDSRARQTKLLQDSQAAADDTRAAISRGDITIDNAGTYWATKHAPQIALDYWQNGDAASAQKIMAFAQEGRHQDIMNKQATLAGALHWAKDSGNFAPVDNAMRSLYNALPPQVTGGAKYDGAEVGQDGSISVTFSDPKSGKQFRQSYRDMDTLQSAVEPYLNPQTYYMHAQNAGLIKALDGNGQGAPLPASAGPSAAAAAPSADLLSPQPIADAAPGQMSDDAKAAQLNDAAKLAATAPSAGSAPAADASVPAAVQAGQVSPDVAPGASIIAAEAPSAPQDAGTIAPQVAQAQPVPVPVIKGAAPAVPAQLMPMPAPGGGTPQPAAAIAAAPQNGGDASAASVVAAAPASPAGPDAGAAAQVSAPAPAIDFLRANPNLASQFDAKYGAGAAARILSPDAGAPTGDAGPAAADQNVSTVAARPVDPAQAAAFAHQQPAAPVQNPSATSFAAIPQQLRDFARTLLSSSDPAQVKQGQALVMKLMDQYIKPAKFESSALRDQYGNPVPAFVNESTRTITPVGPDGKPIAAGQLQSQQSSVMNLHGDDFLSTLDPSKAQLVKNVAEGRAPYPTGYMQKTPFGQWLIQAVGQYDPSANAYTYATRAAQQKNYMGGGKQFQELQAISTVAGHLHDMMNVADKLDNVEGLGPLTSTANSIIKTYREHAQDPRIADFNTVKQAVSNELSKAYRGGVVTEGDVHEWQSNLNASQTPTQLKTVIGRLNELLDSKRNALEEGYRSTMGRIPLPSQFSTVNARTKALFDDVARWANTAGSSAPGDARNVGTVTPSQAITSIPAPNQRIAGKVYATPQGPAQWMGDHWQRVQ